MAKMVSDVIILPRTSDYHEFSLDEHPLMMVFVELLYNLERARLHIGRRIPLIKHKSPER